MIRIQGVVGLIIKESSQYKRDLKKLEKKHMVKEINNIKEICEFVTIFNNMHELLSNNQRFLYGIEKKKGNLKEIYTAKVNSKIRLYMHPVGDYPYNLIEIDMIELEKIDDKHYGEG